MLKLRLGRGEDRRIRGQQVVPDDRARLGLDFRTFLQESLPVQDERTITHGAGILEGVQAHQDRAPHGGPLDGSAYPRARRAGSAFY